MTFLHSLTLFLWHSYTLSLCYFDILTLSQMMRFHNIFLCFYHTNTLTLSHPVSTTLLNSHILFLWHYNTLLLSRPVSMTLLYSFTVFLPHSYILSHYTHIIFLRFLHSLSLLLWHSYTLSLFLWYSYTLSHDALAQLLFRFLWHFYTFSFCFYHTLNTF